MKSKFLSIAVVLCMLMSCGPSKHTMYIDMRQPSKAGVDLAGKNVSVVFLETDNEKGN